MIYTVGTLHDAHFDREQDYSLKEPESLPEKLKKDIVVATYREGVPEGIAARAFYKRLGFVEGKLTEEFGSPVQELILVR